MPFVNYGEYKHNEGRFKMNDARILKSTKYCNLLRQGRVDGGDVVSALERIEIKSTGNIEIRFSFYKKNKNGKDCLVPRPLDLSEEELLLLFEDALQKRVLSPSFLQKLKEII